MCINERLASLFSRVRIAVQALCVDLLHLLRPITVDRIAFEGRTEGIAHVVESAESEILVDRVLGRVALVEELENGADTDA